jgi:hypothetical protein
MLDWPLSRCCAATGLLPYKARRYRLLGSRDPQALTRCSVSGLDAMMLHYTVRDFLDWTPRVICTCCCCNAMFICRVSYHGDVREAAGGLYARPRERSALAQDHNPTLPGDVALHQALKHQSVNFDSCAASEGEDAR